ncbi:hypothetical protein P9X10_01315 [Bacillus cereus]|nr:hypothetical protein [Bacillus cereus]
MCSKEREEAKKKLEESMNLPVATIKDLHHIPEGIKTEELEEYLQDFVKPTGKCWCCNKHLYIRWGIQHGMANCEQCGIDVRAIHYFKDEDGKKIRLDATL